MDECSELSEIEVGQRWVDADDPADVWTVHGPIANQADHWAVVTKLGRLHSADAAEIRSGRSLDT